MIVAVLFKNIYSDFMIKLMRGHGSIWWDVPAQGLMQQTLPGHIGHQLMKLVTGGANINLRRVVLFIRTLAVNTLHRFFRKMWLRLTGAWEKIKWFVIALWHKIWTEMLTSDSMLMEWKIFGSKPQHQTCQLNKSDLIKTKLVA